MRDRMIMVKRESAQDIVEGAGSLFIFFPGSRMLPEREKNIAFSDGCVYNKRRISVGK